MFTLFYNWILSVFTVDKIGVLIKIMLANAGKKLAKDIFNVENQKKAYQFVKELNKDTNMTNLEKAKAFNKKMREFLLKEGIKIVESQLNCLRELAVTAVKLEKSEDKED